MATYKGAEIIVEYLLKEQVPYLFGLPGHGILGLLDAVYDRRDRIKTISVHHEAAAGFMADAYFRVARRPVVTFASSGAGSANLLVAAGTALADSSAFLAITGNVPTSRFNQGPLQQVGHHDCLTSMRPYVKRSLQTARAEQLPLAMRQAFSTMLHGRPGPVQLDVPSNVFGESTEAEIPEPAHWRHGITAIGAADPNAIVAAVDLLLLAERPVIVAGHGVELAGASRVLARVADAFRIPVAHTPAGAGVFDARSPLSLGATGPHGTSLANQATRNADVILALGTRFDDRATGSWLPGSTYRIPPTKLIHVDVDPEEIGRNYPPAIGIVGDARLVLEQIEGLAFAHGGEGRKHHRLWLEAIEVYRMEWEAAIGAESSSAAEPIHPARLVADLRAVLPDDAILLSDVGVHQDWLVQRWPAYAPRTMLQSWGFAAMGFGVCGVLGAKLAAPERPAVAVVGDGGFLMMPSIVATAVEYDIPAVWLVWNNAGYGSIRDRQLDDFGPERELATSFRRAATGALSSPDCAAMARAMGADGVRVERPDDLRPLLAEAIAAHRPYLLDVRVARDPRPTATAGENLAPELQSESAHGLAGQDRS